MVGSKYKLKRAGAAASEATYSRQRELELVNAALKIVTEFYVQQPQ